MGFRDESAHMNFAFEVVRTVRNEQPELWTPELVEDIKEMLRDAVDCEMKNLLMMFLEEELPE